MDGKNYQVVSQGRTQKTYMCETYQTQPTDTSNQFKKKGLVDMLAFYPEIRNVFVLFNMKLNKKLYSHGTNVV